MSIARSRICCLAVAVLAALASRGALGADVVELLSGNRISGKVLSETDSAIVVRLSMGGDVAEMKLDKKTVHAVTIEGAARRVINEKASATPKSEEPARAEDQPAEVAPTVEKVADHNSAIYKRCSPAVVGITSKNEKHQFFGTGIGVSPKGLVLTLVSTVPPDAQDIKVYLQGGRIVEGKIVESCPEVEATLLEVPVAGLPYLALGDPDKASVGDVVYTLANPDSVIMKDGRPAFSAGVLSGVYSIEGREEYSPYKGVVLETDASINNGSDGGPLLDCYGRLLGVISLSYSDSRFMGTAIPVSVIKQRMTKFNLVFGGGGPVSKVQDTGFCPQLGAVEKLLRSAAAPVVKSLVTLKVEHGDRPRADLTVEEKKQNPQRAMLFQRQRFVQGTNAPTTAVVMSADGYLLTAYSNVSGPVTKMSAVLADGGEVPAKLLGYDEDLDVACLQVEGVPRARLAPVKLSPAGDIRPGTMVAVLGRSEPECDVTFNAGIISANDRGEGRALQADFITNYGNEGGPVVTLGGEVIGVASFLNATTPWNQNSGVSLVARSEKILEVWDELKSGKARKRQPRASLGVQLTVGASDVAGARIERVQPGSPAEKAGIQAGDVIVELGGKPVKDWSELMIELRRHKPGEEVELKLLKGGAGEAQPVKAVLTEQPRGGPLS